MGRRALLTTFLLAALAVAVLLVWGTGFEESGSGERAGPLDPAGSPVGSAPELSGLGTARDATPDEIVAPTGALPVAVVDGQDRIDPDQTRLSGTVHLRGTDIPARSGRVELLLVKPEHWPGSWAELHRLIAENQFLHGIDHQAQIAEDGTWQTDVPRGVRIARTWVRRVHDWSPEIGNFLDTKAPARVEVAGERLALDLEVRPGRRIAGRVVDDRTGKGVAGARVIRDTLDTYLAGAVSEGDGSFVVSGLREVDVKDHSPLDFRVEHPAYVRQHVTARFDPARGAYEPLEVRLRTGVLVAGVVRMDGKSPRHEVQLFLLARGDRAVPFGAAERRLAHATTDKEGRFSFPPVAAMEEATLRVPSQGHWLYGGGAGVERQLDLRKDNTKLKIELTDTWGAALHPRFPDGAIADGPRVRALVQDVTGAWCPVSWGGNMKGDARRVSVKPGHAHRILVYAERKEENGATGLYRGEVVARFQSPDEAERGVWVDLEPFQPTRIPWPRRRLPRVNLYGELTFARCAWLLRVEDATTHEPLGGRTLHIDTRAHMVVTMPVPEDGRLRLEAGLGLRCVRFHVEGYEPLELRLEEREPGYAEAVVSLRRLRDR